MIKTQKSYHIYLEHLEYTVWNVCMECVYNVIWNISHVDNFYDFYTFWVFQYVRKCSQDWHWMEWKSQAFFPENTRWLKKILWISPFG